MKTRSLASLMMLVCLTAASLWTPAHAAWSWRDGPIEYLAGCDANYSPPKCQQNGSGYYVSQAWDPAQGLPRANLNNDGNVFYVKVYAQGIVSGARYIAPYFIPPEGTVLINNATVPVLCRYSMRTGGPLLEFGSGFTQTVTDDSVPGGWYTIGGCPQPPYPTADFNGHTGFRIVRNCNYQNAARDCSPNWPMASGAGYEFMIPVYVDRPMDGFTTTFNFTWLINVLEGFTTNWVQAELPIYASGASVPPNSADMRAVLQFPPAGTQVPAGRTLVEGQCINGGPGAALNARCQFNGLPAGAIVECAPTPPVSSLNNGGSISCSADFATPESRIVVSLQASSGTTDGAAGNNTASLQIIPPAASADLSSTLTLATDEFGFTHVDARCTNNGPNAAKEVWCLFTALTDQASFGCSRDQPVASLAAGESFTCFARFPNTTDTSTVKFQASSNTTDPESSNNTATLDIPGRASADVAASLVQLAGSGGNTRLQGTCVNHGPDRAADATCAFEGLPAGNTVTCTPASGTALAVDQSMVCEAQFPNQAATISVTLRAGSQLPDRQAGNNSASLQVTPPPAGSADLRTALARGQGTTTQSRVDGSCTNAGPDAATNVACSFGGLPAQATVTCNPASPQATLSVNASIQCSALFPKQSQALSIRITATSATQDPTTSNDEVVVDFPPEAGMTVMRDGFE
jgi:hypothetical protein